MKTAFFSLCLLFGGVVAAQTKLISYKSHSGSGPLFAAAYANNLFDMEDSDFGTPPARPVNRIDSLIFLSDSVSVVVRSEGKIPYGSKQPPVNFAKKRDTLRRHPLLQNPHALDSIKREWKSFFKSSDRPVSEVIFIGFDNKRPKDKKKNSRVPIASGNGQKKKNNGLLIPLLLFSIGCSGFIALRTRGLKTSLRPA